MKTLLSKKKKKRVTKRITRIKWGFLFSWIRTKGVRCTKEMKIPFFSFPFFLLLLFTVSLFLFSDPSFFVFNFTDSIKGGEQEFIQYHQRWNKLLQAHKYTRIRSHIHPPKIFSHTFIRLSQPTRRPNDSPFRIPIPLLLFHHVSIPWTASNLSSLIYTMILPRKGNCPALIILFPRSDSPCTVLYFLPGIFYTKKC